MPRGGSQWLGSSSATKGSVASKEALKALASGVYVKTLLSVVAPALVAGTDQTVDSVASPDAGKVIWPRVHFRHWFTNVDFSVATIPAIITVQKVRSGESVVDGDDMTAMEGLRAEGRLFHWSMVQIAPHRPVKVDLMFYNIKPEEGEDLIMTITPLTGCDVNKVYWSGYTEYSQVELE